MSTPSFRVRRATIEDLPALAKLWRTMNLPVSDLERRLTEFQAAVDDAGMLAGAVGFQMTGKHGLVHSEGFKDFSVTDTVRPMLWERLQMLSANHGIVRVWTKENAPFWSQQLNRPDADALAKLPATWAALPGEWLTLKLREDVEEVLSLDKEFEMFKQSAEQESQAAMGQAKILKNVATVAAIILALVVVAGAIYMLRQNLGQPGR
jgi:N-acetylglutamate synthase-like GNAT family acetyltransferase